MRPNPLPPSEQDCVARAAFLGGRAYQLGDGEDENPYQTPALRDAWAESYRSLEQNYERGTEYV